MFISLFWFVCSLLLGVANGCSVPNGTALIRAIVFTVMGVL
jgi:hypothetical protein